MVSAPWRAECADTLVQAGIQPSLVPRIDEEGEESTRVLRRERREVDLAVLEKPRGELGVAAEVVVLADVFHPGGLGLQGD